MARRGGKDDGKALSDTIFIRQKTDGAARILFLFCSILTQMLSYDALKKTRTTIWTMTAFHLDFCDLGSLKMTERATRASK